MRNTTKIRRVNRPMSKNWSKIDEINLIGEGNYDEKYLWKK